METLNIHSHMAQFRLVERISKVSSEGIWGEASFNQTPIYAGLEAMAQLAALDVRQRFRFERHAFLLKVQHCRMPAMDVLEGDFRIKAELCSQSSMAFHYNIVAQGPCGVSLKSELLIGTQAYDEHFPEDILKPHYQRVWTQLKA